MTHPSRFVRLMSAVADFSHPFYAEERQRQVWNEAQTVGMQLVLWLGLVLANVMVWTGDRQVAVFAVALVALLVVVSLAITAYAKRLAVDATSSAALHPERVALYLVLYLGFVLGAVLNLAGGAIQGPTVLGLVVGAAVGVVVVVLVTLRQRRDRVKKADALDPDADVFDDETAKY